MTRASSALFALSLMGLLLSTGCGEQASPRKAVAVTLEDNAVLTATSETSNANSADPATTTAAQSGSYGTITGRLVWGGNTVPEPNVIVKQGDASIKDAQVCAAETLLDRSLSVDSETKGIRYGLAFLFRPKGANPSRVQQIVTSNAEVVIDQKNCEFLPYIDAIYKDQKLKFTSSDPVSHNVRYSGFTIGSYNQILPPQGSDTISFKAGERRPTPVFCDIHPWMKGWFMVLDHPFFAVTQEDGSFEIQGVPAGTQNLVVWQEKAGYVNEGRARGMAVTVEAGQTLDLGEMVIDPSSIR